MAGRLRLYVAGATPASQRAVTNITALCASDLSGRYTLEVVDLYQHPDRALEDGIVAAPTLARLEPGPRVRIVGDLGDREQVLAHLDVQLDA